MKKLILTLNIFFAFTVLCSAQNLPDFNSYKLEKAEDYGKTENVALQAADYLFSTPFKDTLKRTNSELFILQWMEGTPDYTFDIDNKAASILGNKYLRIYLAASLKYRLENHLTNNYDTTKAEVEIWKIIANYVSNPSNEIKATGKLKKLCKANEKGELEDFLGKA